MQSLNKTDDSELLISPTKNDKNDDCLKSPVAGGSGTSKQILNSPKKESYFSSSDEDDESEDDSPVTKKPKTEDFSDEASKDSDCLLVSSPLFKQGFYFVVIKVVGEWNIRVF